MNVAKPIQVNWAEVLTPLIPTGSHPWGVSVEVSGLEVVLSAMEPKLYFWRPSSEHQLRYANSVPEMVLEVREWFLQREALRTIRERTVEDGVVHPGEEVLSRLLPSLGLIDYQNFFDFCGSDFVQLLGRLPVETVVISIRERVVAWALQSVDSSMREAGMMTAEQWGGSDMIVLLETHVEPDPFLDDYRRRVLRDLKGE
jgi:hypothetical protein